MFIVLCTIRNSGRTAQFSVTIDSIDGATHPLEDPYFHLLWWNRGQIIVEEIPTAEHRVIAVADVRRVDGELCLWPIDFVGQRKEPHSHAVADRLTVWIRISARHLVEYSYTRRIGIDVRWATDDAEPTVTFADDPPDAEIRMETPAFGSLLDF
jgi:hypothetical protein